MLLLHQIVLLCLKENLLERIQKLIMAIDDKIRDENLQYDINREAAKVSAQSSSKINEYEYLSGEEIVPSDQRRVIEQARFTYSPLEKTLEKWRKTIENQEKKQIDAITNQNEILAVVKKYLKN